ncbi:MAG: hypothetical protein L0Y73_03115 [Candidatus Aminicenantes bacterium]|nr:hypothetical protein [Candidatus Aminicenantes bacterium]
MGKFGGEIMLFPGIYKLLQFDSIDGVDIGGGGFSYCELDLSPPFMGYSRVNFVPHRVS